MRIVLLIVLSFATGSGFTQNNTSPKKQLYQFVELKHRLSKDKIPSKPKQKDSLAWGSGPYQFFKVIKSTDSVPARLNTVFGIEFKVTGMNNPDLRYTQEWIYPAPMKEEDGRKYALAKVNGTMSTNHDNTCSYSFGKSYELLKGPWKLNVYVENKLMFTRTFIVY